MKKSAVLLMTVVIAIAIILLIRANYAGAQTSTPSQPAAQAQPAGEEHDVRRQDPMPNLKNHPKGKAATPDKSKAASAGASEKQFGSKESAKWTETTEQSATNAAQKQWLAHGRPVTVTGEVVDVSCYMQLGKTGEKHIDCGSKCVRNGQPIGVLTKNKVLYLVIPEEHHPRRDGQTTLREQFAAMMGKQVTVTGMLQQRVQGKAIFVSGL